MPDDNKKPKNSTWRLFWQTLIVEDLDSIKDKLFYDYFIPSTKNVVADMGTAFLNLLLFGDSKRGGYYKGNSYFNGNQIKTPYGTISRTTETGVLKKDPRTFNNIDADIYRRKASVRYEDIPFDSMVDAEEALSEMRDILEQYEKVSVADYYEICTKINHENYHYESDWTTNNYGWTDLSYVKPTCSRGYWFLTLPRTVVIKE